MHDVCEGGQEQRRLPITEHPAKRGVHLDQEKVAADGGHADRGVFEGLLEKSFGIGILLERPTLQLHWEPGLAVAGNRRNVVEPGLGWVAWYLYIIDDMATRQKYDLPGITELPSFYFHRNVFLTFIEEPDAVQLLRHRLGTRNIMWSSDYPHPVSSWPNSRKIAEEQTAGMSAEDRDLVLAGNAARVWNL